MRLTAQSIIFPTIYGYCLPSRNSGRGSIIFDKGKDLKSRAAITLRKKKEGQYFRATNAMRLYGDGRKKGRQSDAADPLVLKRTPDEWVKGAYREGTKDYLARTRGL
jgi:hypothetical protein